MKVEVDLTEYGVKAPKWYDPINPHVINASGGSGGSNDVELTCEEYEALSEEEKMNGSNYFITDIGNPKSLTTKVLFLNSVSSNTEYTLSDSYKNYDFIKIDFGFENVNNIYNSIILPKERFVDTNTFLTQFDFAHSSSQALRDGYYAACQLTFLNNNTFKTESSDVSYIGGWSSNYIVITGYRYERVVVPNQMVNYSTVEARIGTWIDGKPLYRRTYVLNTGIKNNYNYYLTDISDTELEIFFIDYNGSFYFYSPSGSIGVVPYNYSPNAASVCAEVAIDSSEHKIRLGWRTGADAVNQPLYITIQYTKTTD